MECHTNRSSISICRREETLPAPLQGALCNGASRNPGRCPGLMCIGTFSAETPNDARSLAAERKPKGTDLFNEVPTQDTLESILLPYQRAWLTDRAPVKVYEKS